ncbi:MazG nucleotide pyrophosphohydrolase domain-containing protein [Methanosarcina sp. UBA289]|uniref:MazG nucleotide pyrophosphohydrolase domain-containing protein n=1 Tax=Methanosarcina sp. UBA289 TaxID=1915574 RepID=UPI0025ED5294|nr:MazG nucleotide pyrophosphohydrolase domain-containing protein [Methanosarcina sp. UBA289]
MIYELYDHNDRKREGNATILWLVEEIGELAEAIRREELENIEGELADYFAWIGALLIFMVWISKKLSLKSTLACVLIASKNPICTE